MDFGHVWPPPVGEQCFVVVGPKDASVWCRRSEPRGAEGRRVFCTRDFSWCDVPGFSRDLRIRKRRDYLRVQQSGQRLRVKGRQDLLVLVAPGTEAHSRYGITVSRKVGNAVTRNRVKRWLREAIRHERSILPDGSVFDVVFIARSAAATAGAGLLQQQVRRGLQRLVVMDRESRRGMGT